MVDLAVSHAEVAVRAALAAGAHVNNLAGGPLHTGEHGMIAAADAETHTSLLSALNTVRQEDQGGQHG